MIKNINTKFNFKVETLDYQDNYWLLNGKIKAKSIILTTGYDTTLLDEKYIKIRPVWGRRIDVNTSTSLMYNYHKSCSISKSKDGIVSIGATHHRDKEDIKNTQKDIDELLSKASDILNLDDVKVVNECFGARASSFDYLPIVGDVINSTETIKQYPYLKNGTKVPNNLFSKYNNLYMINGVGGRGFVLSPYLSKILVDYLLENKNIDDKIKTDRLFIKDVKRNNKENK